MTLLLFSSFLTIMIFVKLYWNVSNTTYLFTILYVFGAHLWPNILMILALDSN